jgi:hypothetical protein
VSEIVQIHHAHVQETMKYIVDPVEGLVQRPVRNLRPSGTDRIKYGPTGETYEIQSDGSFHLPREVADYMLRMPGWTEGPSPFAAEVEEAEHKPRASRSRKPVGAEA